MALGLFPLPSTDQPYLTTHDGVKMEYPYHLQHFLDRCEMMDDITGLDEVGRHLKILVESKASNQIDNSLSSNPSYLHPTAFLHDRDDVESEPHKSIKLKHPDFIDYTRVNMALSRHPVPVSSPASVERPPGEDYISTPKKRRQPHGEPLVTPAPKKLARMSASSPKGTEPKTKPFLSEGHVTKLSLSGIRTPVRHVRNSSLENTVSQAEDRFNAPAPENLEDTLIRYASYYDDLLPNVSEEMRPRQYPLMVPELRNTEPMGPFHIGLTAGADLPLSSFQYSGVGIHNPCHSTARNMAFRNARQQGEGNANFGNRSTHVPPSSFQHGGFAAHNPYDVPASSMALQTVRQQQEGNARYPYNSPYAVHTPPRPESATTTNRGYQTPQERMLTTMESSARTPTGSPIFRPRPSLHKDFPSSINTSPGSIPSAQARSESKNTNGRQM